MLRGCYGYGVCRMRPPSRRLNNSRCECSLSASLRSSRRFPDESRHLDLPLRDVSSPHAWLEFISRPICMSSKKNKCHDVCDIRPKPTRERARALYFYVAGKTSEDGDLIDAVDLCVYATYSLATARQLYKSFSFFFLSFFFFNEWLLFLMDVNWKVSCSLCLKAL